MVNGGMVWGKGGRSLNPKFFRLPPERQAQSLLKQAREKPRRVELEGSEARLGFS